MLLHGQVTCVVLRYVKAKWFEGGEGGPLGDLICTTYRGLFLRERERAQEKRCP